MRLFLVSMAIIAICHAGLDLRFVGRTNDMDVEENWKDGVMPSEENDVAYIEMFGDRPVKTSFSADELTMNVGSGIRFKGDGVIKFPSEGTYTFKFNGDSEEEPQETRRRSEELPVASFIGGQTFSEEQDARCHKNYVIAHSGQPTDKPVCSDDTMVLEGRSYALFADGRIDVDRIEFQDRVYTSKDDLETDTFFFPELFFKDEIDAVEDSPDSCKNRNPELYNSATDDCQCFTSCPSDEVLQEQENTLRDTLKELAAAELAALEMESTWNVKYDFDTALSGIDSPDMIDDTFIGTFHGKLAEFLGLETSAITISTLTATTQTTFEGTIVAETGNVMHIGVDPVEFNEMTDPLVVNDLLSDVAETWVVANAILGALQVAKQDQLNVKAQEAADTCGQPCDSVSQLFEPPVFTDPDALLADILACNQDEACIKDALDNAPIIDGATRPDTTTLATNLKDVDPADPNVGPYVQAYKDAKEQEMSTPMETEYDFPPVMIFDKSPAIDIFYALGNSKDELETALVESIVNQNGILSVMDLMTKASYATSRRRSTQEEPDGVEVTFSYTKMCKPMDDCEIQAGSEAYNSIADAMGATANAFSPENPECMTLEAGRDMECVEEAAQDAYDDVLENGGTVEEAEQAALDRASELLECDRNGRKEDGTCWVPRPDDEVEADANGVLAAVEAPSTVQTTTNEAGGSGSGSGGSIGIIAGAAAGGVIVLILIIVLVVKFSGSGGSTAAGALGKSEDRTVVAFENPMYDDPAQNDADGGYDNAAPIDDGEGLYDEPAFNADKANPMYQSADDLAVDDDNYLDAGDEGEDGGGYLDVAPDDE